MKNGTFPYGWTKWIKQMCISHRIYLSERAHTAMLEISVDDLKIENGVDILLERLGLFLQDAIRGHSLHFIYLYN